MNIAPGFSICTAGDPAKLNTKCGGPADCNSTSGNCVGPLNGKTCTSNSPVNANGSCTSDAQCNYTNGACTQTLECSGNTSVVVTGWYTTPNGCESDGCNAGDTCNTQDHKCEINDVIPTTVGSATTGQIDVCYSTPSICTNNKKLDVTYCGGVETNNVNPNNTLTFVPSGLRADPNSCGAGIPTCTNQVGSLCCGLTQGAYGAPNSVATTLQGTTYGSCPNPLPSGLGYLPAAACAGADAFAQVNGTNATTIGIPGTQSVTIDNLETLIAYLPSTSTPNPFKDTGPFAPGTNTHYATPGQIPDPKSGGSTGQGGGTLSGQTMACSMNTFLSSNGTGIGPTGGVATFTPAGFGNFQLPAAGKLLCTRRSGEDKVLGTSNDICQAFSYPSCVAGQTVDQVRAAANNHLANGSNSLVCSASNLNNALNNINVQFDQCGWVIDCGLQAAAGVFTCPSSP